MKYYFRLQYAIFRRQIEDIGFPFIVGLLLCLLLYIALFAVAIKYPQYAPWILGYVSISLLYKLANRDRTDFLKNIFTRQGFLTIRSTENIGCILPFIPIAIYEREWLLIILLLLLGMVFTIISIKRIETRNIPTPFRSSAFEFIILFRRLWLLLVICYALAGISIYFDNINLPVVLLGITVLMALGAYDIIEDEYIVWNNALSASRFITYKIRTGSIQLSILIAPFILLLLLFGMPIFLWGILCWVSGLLLLILVILMKYAAYPRRIGITETIACMIIVMIPILLVAAYPYYYKKAIQNLKQYL
ncbi:hypothetical protein H8B06_16390 [Sphingobacterium sp. DN00404]|uniref:ABC transporter permease n=1 Tax=Sphingobacterium micropteri TaxID=2763501 RepID=A0ABR7YSV1_9SPHI|nr:hypothetical protein [Sphingobacterium micropteri]MBD1434411.1 hypothetical protein [Sphingobacterium micropteri]